MLTSFLFAVLGLVSFGAVAEDIFFRQEAGQSIVISNVPATDDFNLLIADRPASTVAAGIGRPSAQAGAVDPAWPRALLARARHYAPWVDEAARESRLDARLVHAVIAVESGYNPLALSPKGSSGLMQLQPATALRYGVANKLDARQNIQGGVRYLADLLRLFGNDTGLALAAYNAGENAVWRHGGKIPPYPETVAYVPRVLDFYRRLKSASLPTDPNFLPL